ncbi:MFS transporter [Terasakiispira papahanaumokuakeensis]|uniref:MFS transporter n=1 Tax=Terasakiispira papahanaumokuakeensis TaxID=197479 RepID=A0A1E2VCA9_9GAMM|nr:MFS transporter [Terasakiispira papahanaumokuakeensis]ODC04629.1 MFS transporter [Terasakiispira papahanaumokuakeensis]
MTRDAFSMLELRAISGLAGLYGLRMLGLFMVLPVLALLLAPMPDATPARIGIAVGVYGLTQAVLQVPFGWLSDRFGRKPMIILGLLLFALGSFVAAGAETLTQVIAGRALQGAGAVASVLMALLADLTREERRTQAMATVGMSIGLAFMVAMATGPWLADRIGLSGLFLLTAGLSLAGILVVLFWVPKPGRRLSDPGVGMQKGQFLQVLKDGQLLRLDLSIFTLHMLLTASFIAVPGMLKQQGWALSEHGLLYLATMGLGFFAMVPLIIVAEKKQKMKPILLLVIALLGIAVLGMGVKASHWWLPAWLWLFFLAFNVLEASLPSLISKQAPVEFKGSAMGVYSSAQFLGAFVGGMLGGALMSHWGASGLLEALAACTALWWLIMLSMRKPRHLSSHMLSLNEIPQTVPTDVIVARLMAVRGVEDVMVQQEPAVAWLKVDRSLLDEEALNGFLSDPGASPSIA